MGGLGSGRWYRWSGKGKTVVQAVRSVDVNRWHRERFLRRGNCFAWMWRYSDGTEASINVEAGCDGVVLRYRCRQSDGEWEDVEEFVDLERTPCNLGGFRPWFCCPRCRRRCAKLYGAGKYFLCRRCYDLAYQSQRERSWDRALHRAQKIRMSLGGDPALIAPFPLKPKGMQWRTYEKLRRKAREAEFQSLIGVSALIDKMGV